MSDASQAFIDTYGSAMKVTDSQLSPFQRRVKDRFAPLVQRVRGMEMHAIGRESDSTANTVMLVIFRAAQSHNEFEIMLDVDPTSYQLEFAGYEENSTDKFLREVAVDDNAEDYLFERVNAALSGRIKIKETSTAKGPFKWEIYELQPTGEWEQIGSVEDWPKKLLAKKSFVEKRIQIDK